jgi:hypothetical protein
MFGDIYRFAKTLATDGGYKDYKGFQVLGPHDGKALNYILGRGGGGAKVSDFFCCYCCIRSKDILAYAPPTTVLACQSCRDTNRSKCRHYNVMDSVYVDQCKQTLDSYTEILYFDNPDFLKEWEKLPALHVEEIHKKESLSNHIAYDYSNACPRYLQSFATLICEHVTLRKKYGAMRNVNVSSTPSDNVLNIKILVEALSDELIKQTHVNRLKSVLSLDEETVDTRMMDCEAMIFDSLHLVNRTVERIYKILFQTGARYTKLSGKVSRRKNQFK